MIQNILIATDGSTAGERAADFAASLAKVYQAKIIVLYAYHPVPSFLGEPYFSQAINATLAHARNLVNGVAERLRGMGAADVEVTVMEGPAAEAILNIADTRKSDLIVVGARGLSAWRGAILGSVSMAVTQRAHCPVLVVK